MGFCVARVCLFHNACGGGARSERARTHSVPALLSGACTQVHTFPLNLDWFFIPFRCFCFDCIVVVRDRIVASGAAVTTITTLVATFCHKQSLICLCCVRVCVCVAFSFVCVFVCVVYLCVLLRVCACVSVQELGLFDAAVTEQVAGAEFETAHLPQRDRDLLNMYALEARCVLPTFPNV